ncbi:uncharacterized protein LOC127104457 [Lathyrus oleraceus]|uniref:uncharacterized protein LOC127104457 n=1 Tax=Pisum sativum TaxID=3888 RepID=UPI0021D1B8D2|nr:uncharacterized protein LOC127104457 [Pisum sativum]
MPSYGKFLKEILSNKKKLEDNETVTLTAECIAIIQNNMPPKLKDPSSFSIPCVIGKFIIDKALCDLGAKVSLMPLSICERLKTGEVRPTRMYLQLAGRFVKFLVGMLENIPIRIGQFYIPTEFIIMDIKADSNIPIILGRPFLATTRFIINVKKGKLENIPFQVGEGKVKFILSQFLNAPTIEDLCCFLDVIDECIKEMEMEQSKYTEVQNIPPTRISKEENWRDPYVDGNLRECLALTPNHIPCPKKHDVELKILPKDLRYEFLDTELKRPVIVNADLGHIETDKLLHVLRKYPTDIGNNILDLKGISPYICMHRIMLEEGCKTSREH